MEKLNNSQEFQISHPLKPQSYTDIAVQAAGVVEYMSLSVSSEVDISRPCASLLRHHKNSICSRLTGQLLVHHLLNTCVIATSIFCPPWRRCIRWLGGADGR